METETRYEGALNKNQETEQQFLKTPNKNDGNSRKETVVILAPSKRGYQITIAKTILFILVAIICIVLAVVITFIVTKYAIQATECSNTTRRNSTNNNKFKNSSKISETGSLNLHPWSGIRLPRSVKPSHYKLHLEINLKEFTYVGFVNITIHIDQPTKFLIFHIHEIDINRSTVSVSSIHSRKVLILNQVNYKENDFYVIELDEELEPHNTFVVTVGIFHGNIRNDLRGLYRSSYKNKEGETRYLAVTQFQAVDARRVFPCFDEPDFKARFEISITYQRGYTALTNMPAISTKELDDDLLRTDYMTTPIMSTYLLAVVVSDFKSRNYTFDNNYELRIWARPEAFSQTLYSLEFAKDCYTFFEEYFGTKDVVPKSDQVAVPDFSGGAMENWGLVVYREGILLYDSQASSSLNKYTTTFVVAHEIAHTWFGNMVTMQWWDDLWLNEGFANLLMYLAMNHINKHWNVFALVIVDDIFPVMEEDALTTSHPVSSTINSPEEINQRFDSISYNKGMAVLRMMLEFAGEESFQRGLRLYIEKYKFKNAQMSQLWDVFTEAFDNTYNVSEIMDTWTRQMGYPVVTLVDSGNKFVLRQDRFLLDQSNQAAKKEENNPFGYKWHIPFTYITQESPGEKKTVWLKLDSATILKPRTGWLLGNYEVVGYFRVMYDRQTWAMLADQLMRNHTVIPEANRAALIGDAFALARINLLEYEIAFNITRYLKKEQSYVPWQAFHHSVEFIKGMIFTRATFVQLQKYISELVTPVLNSISITDKGELPERYFRRVILGMACDLGIEDTVKYAKAKFNMWMNHSDSIPADLSTMIFAVGIREGGLQEWDYVWNRSRTANVTSEEEMLMESLVHTQKPYLLYRYIDWLFDNNKIRLQNVRFVFGYFTRAPLARITAFEFLMSRWNDIVNRFDVDSSLIGEMIIKATLFVNTKFHLKQLEDLFKNNTPKSAITAVENAFALIRSNINWMEKNYEEITAWLDQYKN